MSPVDSHSLAPDSSGQEPGSINQADIEALRDAFGEEAGLEGGGALARKMGIQLREVSPARVVATMPVEDNTQPYGLLHGGASCVLAETAGSVAAALHAGPKRIAVGIDINATHHRGVTSGTVTATAEAVHLGGTVAVYEIAIVDDQQRRICTARLTCLLRDRPS